MCLVYSQGDGSITFMNYYNNTSLYVDAEQSGRFETVAADGVSALYQHNGDAHLFIWIDRVNEITLTLETTIDYNLAVEIVGRTIFVP